MEAEWNPEKHMLPLHVLSYAGYKCLSIGEVKNSGKQERHARFRVQSPSVHGLENLTGPCI